MHKYQIRYLPIGETNNPFLVKLQPEIGDHVFNLPMRLQAIVDQVFIDMDKKHSMPPDIKLIPIGVIKTDVPLEDGAYVAEDKWMYVRDTKTWIPTFSRHIILL